MEFKSIVDRIIRPLITRSAEWPDRQEANRYVGRPYACNLAFDIRKIGRISTEIIKALCRSEANGVGRTNYDVIRLVLDSRHAVLKEAFGEIGHALFQRVLTIEISGNDQDEQERTKPGERNKKTEIQSDFRGFSHEENVPYGCAGVNGGPAEASMDDRIGNDPGLQELTHSTGLSEHESREKIAAFMYQDNGAGSADFLWYNSCVKRILIIMSWYLATLSIVVAIFWNMPDSWRIHSKLNRPKIVFLKPKKRAVDKSVCLVGDCGAHMAPWPYLKISYGGIYSEQLVPAIEKSRLPVTCKTFVVMSGTWLMYAQDYSPDRIAEDNQKIANAIKKKYPAAAVHIIPPSVLKQIVEEEGARPNIRYLPKDSGYEILHDRYSRFFTDSNPS